MQPETDLDPEFFQPDTRPHYPDTDPALEALESKYWDVVRKFERYGYSAKIVEPHDTWADIFVRVPDDGRYPGLEVHRWAVHAWDFHGGHEALITIDASGQPAVRMVGPNYWPDYWAIGTAPDPEPNEYAASTARKIAAKAINPPPIPDHVAAPKVDPFTPHQAGGLLEAIAKWVSRTNRLPAPEFSMLAAIGFVSTLYGRRVVGPTQAGINLYLAGLATTGFGKEHPLQAIQVLAHDTGFSYLIGPGDVTSGAAIEKILRRRPNFIMPMDELGALLQSINGRGAATWARTIRKVLLELFSKSTSMWTGKEYADPTRDSSSDPIHAPTVSLLGMSTPETFYSGLNEESLSDGFLSRLLVISASQRPKAREAAPLVTPPPLIEMVKDYAKALPQPDLQAAMARDSSKRQHMVKVEWDGEEAKEFWEAIEEWQNAQIAGGRLNGVLGRFALQTLKLATIRALSTNPADPKVTVGDVEWGRAIAWHSVTYFERGIEIYMAGSAFEELVNAIWGHLQKSPTGKVRMSDLVRAKGVSKADHRTVKAALDRLAERGDIFVPAIEGRGVVITLRKPEIAE